MASGLGLMMQNQGAQRNTVKYDALRRNAA
jgi:hypothetical protein